MRALQALLAFVAILALLPQPTSAVITFNQLDDGVFTVSHRIKLIGSRGRATKLVYTKAASLCIAAGYSHYKILSEESDAGQQHESANATVRVRFFQASADDRIGCERSSDPQYVAEARAKLQKQGYTPPAVPQPAAEPAPSPASAGEAGTSLGTCTLEQIAAMARAGLSDDKIRAACQ